MASIEKRVRAGKTTYRVRYRDPAGSQRSKVFDRKVDAERWLHANETAKGNNAWVDPAAGKIRFVEQAERWFATTAALRPTTRRDYRKLLDLEILPTFAGAPIASIDALMVREWLATLAAGGLGPKRAGKARAVLRASITLDTYGHLFPDELDQLAGRLEAARAGALEARRAAQVWPHGGPTVIPLSKGAGQ